MVADGGDDRSAIWTSTAATRLGDVEYFCDDELAEQPDKDKWRKGRPGHHRRPSPEAQRRSRPSEYHLANHVVDNFAEFKQYYGLENDPTLVEPGWADFLIDALASPGVAVLLLLIGLVRAVHRIALARRRHRRLRGRWSASCCSSGATTSAAPPAGSKCSLFVAGVSCLLLEMFVIPGFGIFGLGGGAMVLASIVLASQTSSRSCRKTNISSTNSRLRC